MTKRRVLDIGAGSNVDVRATDATDLQAPMYLRKGVRKSPGTIYHPEPVNLGPSRYALFGRLIQPHEKLPYDSDTFELVVSNSALGVDFEDLHGFREAHRVLEPSGRLEIFVPKEFDEVIGSVKGLMRKAGFKNVTTTPAPQGSVVRGTK